MGKKRRRVRPVDVIDGRVEPGPRRLVSLIAEVNPTGRGLSPSEQARRYAEKSALQSLLLRRYGDAFFAEPTEDDGIVLLRHRHFDECACHAQVSSLDDAARAWVWQNLDDAPERERGPEEGERAEPASTEAPRNPATLLTQAQAALAAYDYEEAERLLLAAFESTAGSTPPSRALLELYVDVLGQDGRALELEPRLSAGAQSDPAVRSLIGLAAARRGDAERAVALVRDVEHRRAGEVYAAAGRALLGSEDFDQARTCAAQARSLGAAPEAASLERAIEEALRAGAAVEEAKLEALIAAGDEAGAEAFAREMRSAGFRSARAQQLLRDAAERRAEARRAERTARAREAIEAGEWTAARRALVELARMGRADAALEAALDEAERAAEAAREARLTAEVLEALADSPEEGLARYLALDDGLRAQVRAKGPTERCELADAIREGLKRPRLDEVARAVLHMEALERAVEAEDITAAFDHIEALPREIQRIPDMTLPFQRAFAMLTRAHADDVKTRLDTAIRALNELRWEDVREKIHGLSSLHLSLVQDGPQVADQLARFAKQGLDFEARAARAHESGADLEVLHRGCAALGSLQAYGAHFVGLDRGEEIPEPLRERLDAWKEQKDALVEAMTAMLRFEEHPVPEGTRVDVEDEGELGAHAPDVRIDDGVNVWLIACPEERCYLTEASLPDLIVKRRFSFTVGGGRFARTVIPVGNTLWLPLSDGGMLVLRRDTPSHVVEVWWGGADAEKANPDAWAELAPDASAMVLRTRAGREGPALVLRAHPSGATRPLPHGVTACFFGQPGHARVLVTGGKRRGWHVYDTEALSPLAGAERFTGELAGFLPIAAVDVPSADGDAPEGDHPSEGGHVFLALDPKSLNEAHDEAPTRGAFHLIRVSAEFEPIRHKLVNGACGKLSTWLYRTGDELVVLYYNGGVPTVIMFDAQSLEDKGSFPLLPGVHVPITNAKRDVTALLERDHLNLRYPELPAGASMDPDVAASLPFISGVLSSRSMCATVPDSWARHLFTRQYHAWMLKAATDPFRRDSLIDASSKSARLFERMVEHVTTVPAATLLKMFWRDPGDDVRERLFLVGAEYAVSLCPEDPTVIERLWAAVEQDVQSPMKAHLFHLMGLAYLAAGRRESARECWLRGERIHGDHCPLKLLISIMGGLERNEVERLLPDISLPAFVWEQAKRYERAVLAMGRLDEAIDAGRGEDAWKEARRVRELVGPSWQLSARVALLHLDHPDPNTDPWRYQLDLAWMASQAWLGPTRNHMIFAGHHWDHHRFTEITTRAGEVLDAMGVGVANRRTGATLEAEAREAEAGNTEPGQS